MKYVLGIDQGGSKTQALIADDSGRILGVGHGAGACHSVTGMDSAMEAIADATEQALQSAGIAITQIDALVGGLTGIDWPHEVQLLRKAVSDTLGLEQERIHVVNDCLIAMRAGTARPYGCILCAGSGLNCAVRHPDGREYVFGYYIEDACQGGFALGKRVLQAVYDAASGLRGATSLTQAVLEYMEYSSADAMLMQHSSGGLNQSRVLQLPRILEREALNGDQTAQELLESFGRDIARYAVAGLKRFELLDEELEVVLSGSLFKCTAPQLLNAVKETIRNAAPGCVIVESVFEPLVGAALMALECLEPKCDHAVWNQIALDAHRCGMVRRNLEE